MTIKKDSVIGSVDTGKMDVRLDVLFEQEQMVNMINDNGTTAVKNRWYGLQKKMIQMWRKTM